MNAPTLEPFFIVGEDADVGIYDEAGVRRWLGPRLAPGTYFLATNPVEGVDVERLARAMKWVLIDFEGDAVFSDDTWLREAGKLIAEYDHPAERMFPDDWAPNRDATLR